MERSKSLPVHEWLAVLSILILIISFIIFISLRSSNYDYSNLPSHYLIDQEIEIHLQGAVQTLGRVKVKKGSTLSQALEFIPLTEFADLSELNLKKKLRSGEHIKIPEIQYINIFVSGAVKTPSFLTIPKNIKISELIPFLNVNTHANLVRLSKKRCLVDGDKITIPIKR